jgi:hypothetical protein
LSVNILIENFYHYILMSLWTVLQRNSKRQIVQWRDIFIDGVTIEIIMSVYLLVIFNLSLGARPSSSSISTSSLTIFFLQQTVTLQLNLNTIQPFITFSAATTITLSAFIFWFKFYWIFSTLNKQVYPIFNLKII